MDKNAKILEFKIDNSYNDAYPDAFISYEINGTKKQIFLEIDLFNSINTSKYMPLYNTNETQEKYGEFPTIVIVSARVIKSDADDKLPYKIIRLDFNMDIKDLLQ